MSYFFCNSTPLTPLYTAPLPVYEAVSSYSIQQVSNGISITGTLGSSSALSLHWWIVWGDRFLPSIIHSLKHAADFYRRCCTACGHWKCSVQTRVMLWSKVSHILLWEGLPQLFAFEFVLMIIETGFFFCLLEASPYIIKLWASRFNELMLA